MKLTASGSSRFSQSEARVVTMWSIFEAGACANFKVEPYGALLLGVAAALISVVGFDHVTPCMTKRLKLFDTCGVHNLHGMPGILSAGACSSISHFRLYIRCVFITFSFHQRIQRFEVML